MNDADQSPKVFVSYPARDQDWARAIADKLREQGAQVWSVDAVTPGQEWSRALEEGLRASNVLVVLLDRDTAMQPNVLFEYGAAIAGNKVVIPVVSPNLDLMELPAPWRGVQAMRKESPAKTAADIARAVRSLGEAGDRRAVQTP